ncbi:MAG: serine/threonine-protein kinase [Isosphaeraceae bacterium]
MSPVDRQTAAGEDTLAHVPGAGRSTPTDLSGTTLGDFQVERLLGRGGMGEVYLATQLSLNRPVALKVLRPEVLAKPGYLDRFVAEALTVAKLNHPSIVHVYAMDEIEGIHFIAMEYVEGTNLREYVRKRGALDLPQALAIMKQTGQAIGAAGEAGLIHRDVKPENILIARRGRVKVADFGLCRHMDEDAAHLTQAGTTMGTPAYMSPEQAQGHPLDHRSDLYSLGATFYYMLAGVPPFRADSPVALALKQVREIPSSLLIHRPDLPLEIDRLVMKLMAKNPADRFQSAAEMLAELARIRETIQIPSSPSGEPADGPCARTEEFPASGQLATAPATATARVAPARTPALIDDRRGRAPQPAVAARDIPVAAGPAGSDDAAEGHRPAFSGWIATAAAALGLLTGGLSGWAARSPDVMALPDGSTRHAPGLWIEPRWTSIPRQGSAEDQLRYAQLQAPRDEWTTAWMAVPGNYPHSHDAASRAYAQLARLWYRLDDRESLTALGAELSAWNDAQQRDRDLASLITLALQLRKGDLGAVEKGFEKLAEAEVADMYDPLLVAMHLEICSDALAVAQKAGTQPIARPLQRALRLLARQLNHIELGDAPVLGRANLGAGAAPRSKR